MNEGLAPLPTPFDIAEIPVFERPFPSAIVIACAFILTVAAACFFLYRSRLYKKRAPIRLLQELHRELATAASSPNPSKREFALLWKKISRAKVLLSETLEISPFEKDAEALLYGKHYASTTAQHLLQQLSLQIGQLI